MNDSFAMDSALDHDFASTLELISEINRSIEWIFVIQLVKFFCDLFQGLEIKTFHYFLGPGFEGTWRVKDPQLAANKTSCINTSTDKGTSKYNCHRNFRMGKCGSSQPAAGSPPFGSHGLCPYFYNLAFEQKFIPNNFFKCTSKRLANITFSDVQMGYLGSFDSKVVGDIFVATAKFPKYLVVNGTIDNKTKV